ncbi:hypothetical protein [Armatimonas sp.]|uniref:hypothetical protein n=1 Tax=Armatimonas sp. TaxID=1872638 RepID=UPI00286B4957|nr:hypothetical protein [Armatimonas sp.]
MRQEKAPSLVLKAMKSGGLSLDWKIMPLGSKGAPIGLHLYCIPPPGTKQGDIGPGSTIASSPFHAELWSLAPLQRVNSVMFYEDGNSSSLDSAWVDESRKTIPVLQIRFGVGDVGEWKQIVFPQGILKPGVLQSFSFAENSHLKMSGKENGKLVLVESWTNDESKERTALYRFNGERFIDDKAVWFVLGPTTKTRAEAEAWLKKNPRHGASELIETSKFPGLKPGLWAVVFERCQDRDYADGRAKSLASSGISAYAKKAK